MFGLKVLIQSCVATAFVCNSFADVIFWEDDGCGGSNLGTYSFSAAQSMNLKDCCIPNDEIRSFQLQGPISAGSRAFYFGVSCLGTCLGPCLL